MNSNVIAARIKSALENRILFFLLGLAVWSAGIMSGSVVLMVVSSLAVYAMPFIYVLALNHVESTEGESVRREAKPIKRVSLTQAHLGHPLAVGVK